MEEADEVYVTDTGSSDDTVAKLKSRDAIVNKINLNPWRFDVARNISLNFVPEDVDICVCTDLDELLEPGWRDLLEKAWTPQTTRLKYMYTWSFNPDSSPGVTFWYEKIHQRQHFRWIHPVHEVLEYYGTKPDVYTWEGKIQLNHYPDPSKSRGQYLPLLELAVREAPDDDRNMHYLGRCWLYRAIAEAPHLREPYVEMAQLAYTERDWPRVYHMVEAALKIRERPVSYINEASSWDHTIYDLGAISSFNLGLYEKSFYFAKTATEMAPDNQRLKNNFELIKQKYNE